MNINFYLWLDETKTSSVGILYSFNEESGVITETPEVMMTVYYKLLLLVWETRNFISNKNERNGYK